MNIKHRPNEYYALYSCLPCTSELFKDVKRWFPVKHYKSKQAAINRINKIREQKKHDMDDRLIFKIAWFPYPFAGEDEAIIVYNEDNQNE